MRFVMSDSKCFKRDLKCIGYINIKDCNASKCANARVTREKLEKRCQENPLSCITYVNFNNNHIWKEVGNFNRLSIINRISLARELQKDGLLQEASSVLDSIEDAVKASSFKGRKNMLIDLMSLKIDLLQDMNHIPSDSLLVTMNNELKTMKR